MTDQRSETLKIRLTPDEKADIESRAKTVGLTSSRYARQMLFGVTETSPPPSLAPAIQQRNEAAAAIRKLPTMAQVKEIQKNRIRQQHQKAADDAA